MGENQNVPNSDNTDVNAGKSGDASDDNQDNTNGWEVEKKELIKGRDTAKQKVRELAEELKAAKSKLEELDRKKAEESGDVNKLREAFSKDVEKEKARADELSSRLRNAVVKNAFLAEAPNHFVDKSISAVWQLIQADLELEQDEDGSDKVVIKNSALSLSDYLKKYAQENDYLAKNPAKAGQGSKGNQNSAKGSSTLPSNWESLSKEERTQWFRDNPEYKM